MNQDLVASLFYSFMLFLSNAVLATMIRSFNVIFLLESSFRMLNRGAQGFIPLWIATLWPVDSFDFVVGMFASNCCSSTVLMQTGPFFFELESEGKDRLD